MAHSPITHLPVRAVSSLVLGLLAGSGFLFVTFLPVFGIAALTLLLVSLAGLPTIITGYTLLLVLIGISLVIALMVSSCLVFASATLVHLSLRWSVFGLVLGSVSSTFAYAAWVLS